MVDNENIDNTDNNETEAGGRKRKGLFGARRVVRRGSQAENADASGTPAAPAAEASSPDARTAEANAAEAEAEAAPAEAAGPAGPGAAHEPPALPEQHGEP
ncbi:MAG: ribonuclease E/G, partial [Leifsonia sp.]